MASTRLNRWPPLLAPTASGGGRARNEDHQRRPPAVVAGPAHRGPELRLVRTDGVLDELLVLGQGGARLLNNRRDVALADEQDDGELRVAPRRVAKQLVDGVCEALRARPELALAD